MRKFPSINLIKEKTTLELLKDEGVIVRLVTEFPLYLNNPDKIYIVHFGLVDVFYQKRNQENKILSPRKYLHAAERNDLIINIGSQETANEKVDLLVVSSQAELVEIDRSVFFNFLTKKNIDNELLQIAELWIEKMLHSLFNNVAPRNFVPIKADENYSLSAQNVAYPHSSYVWLRIESGIGTLGTDSQTEFSKGQIIPIFNQLWLTAKENAEITVFDTNTMAQKGWLSASLKEFIAFLSETLNSQVVQNFEADKQQLSNQKAFDRKNMEHSLQGFANILDNEKATFNDNNSNDDLLWAFEQIGENLGVTIQSPSNLEAYPSAVEAIAHSSKLRMREVMLRADWWQEENGHLLAFTEAENIPVALIQKGTQYYVADPEEKKLIKVTAEIADSLTPKAFMFFRPFDEPITSVFKLWRFATKGLEQDAKLIASAAFMGAILGLFTPILIGVIMDDVIPLADTDYLVETVGIMVVLAIVSALLTLIQNIFLIRIETKGTLSSQATLMDYLLRLPVTFFKKYSSGDLANRVLSINTIRQILSNSVLQVVLSGLFSFVNLGLLFYYNSKLAILGLVLAVVAMLVVMIIGYQKLQYNREMTTIRGKVQSLLFEFILGITKVRIAGAESRIFALWSKQFTKLKALSLKAVGQHNKMLVFKSGYPLFTNMLFFFFIYYQFEEAGKEMAEQTGLPETIASVLALKNKATAGISVGVFLAFITAFRQFLDTTLKMGEVLIDALNVVPLYERLQPILEAKPASENKTMAKPLLGGIEINHLKFKYEKEGSYIINNVSLNIEPNEMVAVVGASGSGKSTLMRVLLGFEQSESGAIYYDEQDFSNLDLSSVRSQIGVVLQNGALMPTSIFNNIIGSNDLTVDDAWEAARLVGMEDDIKQMPMQMNTILSEGGTTLSGGQRQRLMIARAIVHRPKILFFDEATSALDNHTQKIVTESLNQLQSTRIVIAHRLSTIENADKIFVMDKGVLVEQGTFSELMENYGAFYELAKRQMA